MRPHLFIAVASLAAALAPAGALAQQSPVSSSRLMFDPSGIQDSRKSAPQPQATTPTTTGQSVAQQSATQPPAARQVIAPPPHTAPTPTPKPATRTTTGAPASPAPVRRAVPTERVINDTTVANQTRTTARPVPREEPNLGRLSLPQGSVGYEGKTQMQTYDMSDGRRVPGFENIQRNDSSYFGLSLRMPTAPTSAPSSSSSWSSSPSSFGSHGAN